MGNAVQDYEMLLKVRTDLMDAIAGLGSLTESMGAGNAAAKQLSESADQASDRIQKMVEASTAAAKAQQQTNAAMAETSRAAADVANTSPAQSAGGTPRDTAAEAAAFNASVQAKVAALAELNAAMAGKIGTDEGAAAAEAALDKAVAQGAVSLKEQAVYLEAVTAARAEATAVTVENTAAMTVNAGVTREIGVLLGELARGNTARLEGSLTVLANRTGLLGAAFSPLGLAIGATVAVLGTLLLAYDKGSEETAKFNAAIALTNGYLGVTASQLRAMAEGLIGEGTSFGQAETALLAVANTGKFAGDSLKQVTQIALDMSKTTGVSVEKAVQDLVKLQDDPVKAIQTLDEQYHFLTQSTLDHIKALQQQGDQDAATQEADQALADHFTQVANQQQEQLGTLQKWWQSLRVTASGAWDAMLGIGRKTDIGDQLGAVQGRLTELAQRGFVQFDARKGQLGYAPTDKLSAEPTDSQKNVLDLIAQYKQLTDATKQANQAAADTSDEEKRIEALRRADDAVDKLNLSMDRNAQKQKAITELNAQFQQLWKNNDGNDPRLANVTARANADGTDTFSGGLYDQMRSEIDKRYAGPKPKSDTGAENAQQELLKMLNDEQGALDPVSKAWSTYNDAVQRANELAAKAAKAHGANVSAIDAERDAIIKAAAAARDDTLAKQADKAQEAYERLRASLHEIDGTTFDKVKAQLQQLDQLMKQSGGKISPDQYNQTRTDIINNSLVDLPDYTQSRPMQDAGFSQGPGAGAFSRAQSIDKDEANLDDQYGKALQQLDQYHEQYLLSDQQFVAKENALYKQHNDEMQQLEDAKQQLTLAGIQGMLQQGADALKAGFGAQSDAYKAAFALSKGAAIAQASLSMYQAIAKAEEVGWPANIAEIALATSEGMQIIGQISSISAGFAGGGFTGHGGKHEVAGVVHRGEGVFSQEDIHALGGPAGFHALRSAIHRGYADGGYVGSTAGFGSSSEGRIAPNSLLSTKQSGSGGQPNNLKIVSVFDRDQAAREITSTSHFEQAVLHVVGDNPTTVKQRWNR